MGGWIGCSGKILLIEGPYLLQKIMNKGDLIYKHATQTCHEKLQKRVTADKRALCLAKEIELRTQNHPSAYKIIEIEIFNRKHASERQKLRWHRNTAWKYTLH